MGTTQSNKIQISGTRAIIPRELANLAAPILTYSGPGGSNGFAVSEAFYEFDRHGNIRTHADLVPYLARQLKERGVEVEVAEPKWRASRFLKLGFLGDIELSPREDRILASMAENRRLRVVTRGLRESAKLIGLAARMFGKAARILVVTKDRDRQESLRKQLRHQVDRPVRVTPKGGRELVVCCTESFAVVDPDWDVVLFDGTHGVTSREGFGRARRLDGVPMYAFEHEPNNGQRRCSTARRTITQWRLEAILGPRPEMEERASRVNVQFVESPFCRSTGKLSALDRKRSAFWHNDKRNCLVVDIAAGFASQDVRGLQRAGVHAEGLADYLDASPSVAVLVESLTHARTLDRLLPGWRVLAAEDVAREPCASPHKVIATELAAMALKWPPDVVVRATGLASPFCMDAFPDNTELHDVMVVDLADDFDDRASQETQDRMRDYAHRGWNINSLVACGI